MAWTDPKLSEFASMSTGGMCPIGSSNASRANTASAVRLARDPVINSANTSMLCVRKVPGFKRLIG